MNDLYKEELLDIYKNPSHKGSIPDSTVSVSKENSMCGDQLTLDLIVENNVITDAKFNGSACSVSVISADLLLEELVGKTVEEAQNFTKDDLLKLLGLNLTTSRVKCATLILGALEDALKKYSQIKDFGSTDKPQPTVRVTKGDNLASVINAHPEVEEILYDYGLHCVGCALSAFDSIEAGSKVHGLEGDEIDEMVDRINEVIAVGE